MESFTSASDPPSVPLSGNRLVSIDSLSTMISTFACPACETKTLNLRESDNKGLNTKMDVRCSKCAKSISQLSTSNYVGLYKTAESNLRVVAAGRNCGLGFDKIVKFIADEHPPTNAPQNLSAFVQTSAFKGRDDS